MAEIITYNSPLTGNPNQCFCQMKFDDGMRILISQSREGIKIIKLLFGVIPTKTIYSAGLLEIRKHEKIIGKEYSNPLLMDCYIEKIKPLINFNELLQLINI